MKCRKSTGTEGLRATALGYTKAMALGAKYGANVLRQKNINPFFILESKM